MTDNFRRAICHPDRKHKAKGLCGECYRKTPRAKASIARWKENNPARVKAISKTYSVKNAGKIKERSKKWVESNPSKVLNTYLTKTYNLSYERYLQINESQGGVCLICHETCTANERLSVDHCHETNEIRGLLCVRCNSAVGYVKNRPELARAVAIYLEVSGF